MAAKKLSSALSITQEARNNAREDDNLLAELMANPDYLRYSSTVINDALKEGFDVLQLPNGDIVTTGTKTIVTTYVWDGAKKRLEKAKAPTEKSRARKAEVEAVE